MLLSGEVWNPVMVIYPLAVGVLAEALHRALGYDTVKGLRVSYAVMSLITFSQMLSLWTNTETYVSMAAEEMGSEAYGAALRSYATPVGFALVIILTLAVGYGSTYLTGAVFKNAAEKYALK